MMGKKEPRNATPIFDHWPGPNHVTNTGATAMMGRP